MSLLASLSDLIFPTRCLGCLELGPTICSKCRVFWHPHIYRGSYGKDSHTLKIYSSVQYSAVAQRVLLGSKESGLTLADHLVEAGITNSLKYFIREVGMGVLVPIPSRASMVRKRGRRVLSDLIASVIQENQEDSQIFHTYELLTHLRSVRDQSTLNRSQRERNLEGALRVIKSVKIDSQRPIILVDDLVTSGATLLEAARALRMEGLIVLGAVTACVSQPLR
jgi:predicted amidophosphoribosyltransferase